MCWTTKSEPRDVNAAYGMNGPTCMAPGGRGGNSGGGGIAADCGSALHVEVIDLGVLPAIVVICLLWDSM